MTFKSTIQAALFSAATLIAFTASAQAQDFMTQKELLATIPGSTLYGVANTDNKSKWVQAYGKGRKRGKIAGLWNGKDKYKAKWFVKDDMWCEKWDGGEACFRFVRLSDKKLQPYKEGTTKQRNPWMIK